MECSLRHGVLVLCADDAHGTPIMLRAQQEGVTPEALIASVWEAHRADFAGFHIGLCVGNGWVSGRSAAEDLDRLTQELEPFLHPWDRRRQLGEPVAGGRGQRRDQADDEGGDDLS